MKKVFTLFAAAVLGFSAYAQMPEVCPAMFYFEPLEDVQDASCVYLELQITNSSENLNGFNISIQKPEAAEWVMVDDIFEMYSTNEGYGHNILGAWEGSHTDAQYEAAMSRFMDFNTSINNGKLVIVELLKTNTCRFYPIFEEAAPVAKFAIDFTGCEDTKAPLEVWADNTDPEQCSFAFTGGVEGTRAWSPEETPILKLDKVNGQVMKAIETCISTISTDQNVDNRIFDLQGRELQSVPEHGIYIQNGKKYVK